jgi:DNA-binding transcriptional LysR family regulator
MLSATRKINQNRSGVDLEVVVGPIDSSRAQTIFLTNYFIRLYASPKYLAMTGTPQTIDDIKDHNFVSYVESSLQVAELGHRSSQLPNPAASFQSTSIFAQVEAVRRHSGIGLLPSFMVSGRPDFVPVLPDSFHRELPIWAAARAESLRSMAVKAAIEAIQQEISERRNELAA